MGEMQIRIQMQKAKYTTEFKEEAVRQVIDRGPSVIDVAKRLGIGDGLLYTWDKKFNAANELRPARFTARLRRRLCA